MSCFSILRIEHVGYYGNRIIVFGQREKRKLPNATSKFVRKTKTYRIEGMFAVQIEKYFKGKKLCEREVGQVPLRSVYKQIKHVYDHNGVLIARRNSPSGPLKVTGRGMSKFLDYDKKS